MGPKRDLVPLPGRCTASSAWQVVMPAELLTKIFLFLPSIVDRLRARQTCSQWNNVLVQPLFWRDRSFTLTGEDEKKSGRIASFMAKFGVHLHILDITLDVDKKKRKTKAQSRRICSEMKELLKAEMHLQCFTCSSLCDLENLKKVNDAPNPCEREVILTGLGDMLRQQNGLCVLSFIDSLLSEEEGCTLLQNTVSTIQGMKLQNFFHLHVNVDICPAFTEVMGRFNMLRCLGLSYRYLNDGLLAKLTTTSPVLKYIVLTVDWPAEEMAKVTPASPDWRFAVRNRPNLRVLVDIISAVWEPELPYEQYLLPAMPMDNLTLDLDFKFADYMITSDQTVESNIVALIRCIRQGLRLENLTLTKRESTRGPWNRPDCLVDLVRACPALTRFCLQMTLTLDCLLQVVAVACPPGGKKEEEEKAGPSVAHSTPGTPNFQLHIAGCDSPMDTVRERVSAANPFCAIQICDGCL